MKKTATFRLVYFLLFILTTTSSFSANYTWTGTTNTSWTTATNWTPNGAPAESDSVTIVSASNNPQLSGNRGVHRIVINGGTLDLNGDSLTIYGGSLFASGQVDNGQLILHGTAEFTGTQIGAGVYATCTTASLSGSRFISPVYMEVSSPCTGNGGNTFEGTFTYKVTGSGVFTLAAMLGDTYNSTTEFHNNGVAILDIAAAGINKFNGDVSLYSNGGKTISFGSAGGSTELANGYTLSTPGTFNCVYLNMTGFYQQGNTPQNISITGYTTVNLMQTVWDGSLQLTAPGILLRGNTFNGTTEFNKTASILNQCDGDNAYFQNASFKCSGSDGWRLATRAADTYHADAMFESIGGARLEVAYWGDNSIRGDLTVSSPDVIFGSDNGTLVFDGTLLQAINGNATATIHKMILNKPSEDLTLNTALDISGSVTFVQDNLISTTTNIITFLAGSQAIGASNSSFVSGPVKKVGATAFEFPVGKNESFRPIVISAPNSMDIEYLAEYYPVMQPLGSAMDSTIDAMSSCQYWHLEQLNGNSEDTVMVMYDSTHCDFQYNMAVHLANWDGEKWRDLGEALISEGMARTSSGHAGYSNILIAFRPVVITVSATVKNHTSDFFGYNISSIITNVGGLEFPGLLNQLQSGSSLNPGRLRYPGGTSANWWNWKTGWFFNEDQLPTVSGFPWHLPNHYNSYNLGSKDNTISMFAQYTNGLGAASQLTLNMLTSDPGYQAGFIAETHIQNIPASTIELGNEYYLDEDEYLERFTNGADYINAAIAWANQLNHAFGSQVKIGVVGATLRPGDPPYRRRNEWLQDIIQDLENPSHHIDAVILHDYFGSGLGDAVNFPQYSGGTPQQTYNKLFASPFAHYKTLSEPAGEFTIINNIQHTPKPEIWITEMNLFDTKSNHQIHGTWAHALMTTSMLLTYLEDENITLVNIHALVGDGTFAGIYNTTNGFGYGGFAAPVNAASPTNVNQHTALGVALEPIAQTLKRTTTHKQLGFPGVPALATSPNLIPGTYGWYFEGPQTVEVIFVRLDFPSTSVNYPGLSITNLFPAGVTDYTFEQWHQTGLNYNTNPERLGYGIIGNAMEAPFPVNTFDRIFHEIQFNITNGIITVPPYSITKITFQKPSGSCPITLSDNTLCPGESATLFVQGIDPTNLSVTFGSLTGCQGCNVTNQITPISSDQATVQVNYTLNGTGPTSGFSLQVDVTDGLTNCAQTITLYPALPNVTIAVTSPSPGTNGHYPPGPITLTATPVTGAVDYFIWTAGNSSNAFSDPFIQNPNFELGTNETLQLYYSNDNVFQSCWAMQEFVLPSCKADAGPDRKICPEVVIEADEVVLGNCSSGAGLDYLWSTGATTSCITINNDLLSTTPLVYVYTVTVTDGTCSSTDQVSVEVINCCEGTASQFASSGNGALDDLISFLSPSCSTSGSPITVTTCNISSETLYINGDFTIDDDNRRTVFDNCIIYFGPGARILNTGSNTDLIFRGCTLQGCLDMWDGIYISNTATDLFVENAIGTSDNCIIGDCMNCFTVSRDAKVRCTDTDFTDFEKGIVLNDFDSPGDVTITGTDFTGNITLPAPVSGPTYCGICLDDTEKIIIGGNGTPVNTFNTSINGIYSSNSDLEVRNSAFTGLEFGIVAENTAPFAFRLWPQNEVTIKENTFDGTISAINTGIFIRNLNSDIYNNTINQINTGIDYVAGWAKVVKIHQNTIQNAFTGIRGWSHRDSIAIYQNDEISTMPQDPSNPPNAAIEINGSASESGTVKINDNGDINTAGENGMLLRAVYYAHVFSNNIDLSHLSNITYQCNTINCQDNYAINLNCNTINDGQLSSNPARKSIGINSTFVTSSGFHCNASDGNEVGMRFLSENSVAIRHGLFDNSSAGVLLGDNMGSGVIPSLINSQVDIFNIGNEFSGTGSFTDGQLYTFDGLDASNIVFWHEIGSPPYYITSNFAGTGGQPFDLDDPNLSGRYMCDNASLPDIPIECDEIYNTFSSLLSAQDALAAVQRVFTNDTTAEDALTYTLQLSLFRQLLKDTTLLEYPAIEIFYDSVSNSNMGKIAYIETLLKASADDLQNSFGASFESILLEATSLNNSISPSNILETAIQKVNSVYLSKLVYDDYGLDTMQKSTIQAIAGSCPYITGYAVYQARAIESLWNNNVQYSDEVLCGAGIQRLSVQSDPGQQQAVNGKVTVFPNPAASGVVFTCLDEVNGVISVYDVLGNMVIVQDYTGYRLELQVESLAPGIYHYMIQDRKHNHTHSGKLSVAR